MSTRLYVGNLNFRTTSDELREMFSQAGEEENATVGEDRDTGRSRGFAFVAMATAAVAAAAATAAVAVAVAAEGATAVAAAEAASPVGKAKVKRQKGRRETALLSSSLIKNGAALI